MTQSTGKSKQRTGIIGGGILRTLLFWFLAISLLPLIIVVFIISQRAMETLQDDAESKLAAVAKLKRATVHNYFRENITNLVIAANRNHIMDMLNDFKLSSETSGLEPAEFVNTPEWALTSEHYRRDIEFFVYSRDYYDFLLLDFEGNVLYTVKQETDLGTNLFTGKQADTKFGKACQRAFQEEVPVFSDYEEYGPSNHEVFSFIVMVIHDQHGGKTGLLAFQLSILEIDSIMQERTGLWDTGETYLIGDDLKMRSNSVLEPEQTFLKRKIETEMSRLWYQEHMTGEVSHEMEEDVLIYDGPRGTQVLGVHISLKITGVPIGLIAEIETSEAFYPVKQIQRVVIAMLLLTALIVIFISFRVVRQIARPIQELSSWAGRVAEGELKQEIIAAPKNEIGTLATVFRDMVEKRQRAEEELKAYSTKLEEMVDERTRELKEAQQKILIQERLATLGKFSGGISHELRNPLGVIDSSVYYLKTRLKDADEKVLEYLDRIRSQVGKSTSIIESLLNLTRMKEPMLLRLSLGDVLSEAIEASNVPDAVTVIRSFPEEEVAVNGDFSQLGMVFRNIITNSLQAMDDKGSLTVKVGRDSEHRAEISITDTGPGIAPENLDEIFQPLFSTKARGIGFGLSIAQVVLEKHGGTIVARSALGEGTTIIVRLPLYEKTGKEG